jgi:hypothetical protein
MSYADHTDIEAARYLTTSANKQYSPTQVTAIEKIIENVHGEIVEIIGDGVAVTAGLKNIEIQGSLRGIWNAENPDKEPLEYLSPLMIEKLKSYITTDAVKESSSEIYAKETN